MTYHDPCYLGRHNGVYDEPREVLRQVPGLELVEMADSRWDSLCCGGGGGRIWMETPKGERFCDIRVEQALAVEAAVPGHGLSLLHLQLRGQQADPGRGGRHPDQGHHGDRGGGFIDFGQGQDQAREIIKGAARA